MWRQIPSSVDPPWWKLDLGQECVVQQGKPDCSEWQAYAWSCPAVWCGRWCDLQHLKLASLPLNTSNSHLFNQSVTTYHYIQCNNVRMLPNDQCHTEICLSSSDVSTLLWQLTTFLLTDYQTKQRLRYFGLNLKWSNVNNQKLHIGIQ